MQATKTSKAGVHEWGGGGGLEEEDQGTAMPRARGEARTLRTNAQSLAADWAAAWTSRSPVRGVEGWWRQHCGAGLAL